MSTVEGKLSIYLYFIFREYFTELYYFLWILILLKCHSVFCKFYMRSFNKENACLYALHNFKQKQNMVTLISNTSIVELLTIERMKCDVYSSQ